MPPDLRSVTFDRIDRVVARLQQAVEGGGELPDLAELASIAHFSPFHFHRVYRALTGETVGRTVARLRLLRALHLLSDANTPVTDVALAIGYDTPQSFARAFRDAFDATPSEVRAQPDRLAAEIARFATPPAGVTRSAALQVSVVSVDPFEVVALRTVGEYADLDQAYGRLFAWAASAGVLDDATSLYGLPHDDHRDAAPETFEFDCALGFPVAVAPSEPMRLMTLGGGKYLCLRHDGHFDAIEDSVDRLLRDWLPDSGHALRDAPIHYRYLDDPEHVPEALLRTDVFVPIAGAT